MEHATGPNFHSLLLVIVLAFSAPLVSHTFRRWQFPVVVLEIAAGVVFGKSLFNIITPDANLEFLSSFGFAYLMFLSGLEIDVQKLLPSRELKLPLWKTPFALSSGRLVVVFAISLFFSTLLKKAGFIQDSLFISFLLCNTSLGVVMAILKGERLSNTPEGQQALAGTLTADLLSILALSSYVAFQSRGGTLQAILMLLLILSAALAYRMVVFWQGRIPWFASAFEAMAHGTSQLRLRATFVVILLFIAEAQALGTEVILGAFLAGAVVSMILGSGGEELKEKLDVIGYGLLVPIFFIMVGAKLDLAILFSSPLAIPLIGLLLLIVLSANLAGSVLFIPLMGAKNSFAYGLLMITRLSLTVAGASVGVQAGIITPVTETALVILSVLTCVLGPLFFLKLHPARPEAAEPQHKLLIVGNSMTAYRIAEHFQTRGAHVSLACAGGTLESLVPESEVPIIPCNPFSPQEIVRYAGTDADKIVLALRNERKTIEFARVMRHYLGIENLIAAVKEDQTALTLRDLGVEALSTREAFHLALEEYVTSPALYNALATDETKRLFELKVHSGSLAGSRLSELQKDLPEGTSILLMTRDEEALTPDPEMALREGDMLTLLGDVHLVEQLTPCQDGKLCSINI